MTINFKDVLNKTKIDTYEYLIKIRGYILVCFY